MKNLAELEPKDIMSVYSGKNGCCRCGCSGKHSYNPDYIAEAGKHRGYKVDADECNPKMVKRVLGILKRAEDVVIEGGDPDANVLPLSTIVSTVVGNRLYIAYLR